MNVLDRWRRRRQLHGATLRIRQARLSGQGVHLKEWDHDLAVSPAREIDSLVESVLDWCRHTLGECRRPWGIDYFDLALACSAHALGTTRSVSFRRLRTADLYPLGLDDPGHFRRELSAFLSDLYPSDRSPRPMAGQADRCHLAVALFSWGNAAHAALA